jgi:hypothetical protein
LRLSLTKVFGENIISFKNQFDFYTVDLKKYLPKIKLVFKCEYTFFTPWGKKFLACGKVHFQF